MTDPGPLLASGRAADVFDQGDGTVLRRYRTDRNKPRADKPRADKPRADKQRDCAAEGRVMEWVRNQGLPVPEVFHAEGTDLIMEKLDGGTLLDDLSARPWTLRQGAALMADLQRQINNLVAPDWMETPDGMPRGASVTHLDLHPMNIMMTSSGPVIIDWTNCARSVGGFDAALSWVLMSTFEVEGAVDRVGQLLMSRAFLRKRGSREIAQNLDAACRWRLQDDGVTDGERIRIRKLSSRPSSL